MEQHEVVTNSTFELILEKTAGENFFVPNQSVSIAELIQRFERGERLPSYGAVSTNFVPDSVPDMDIDDAPPYCGDIVDVLELQQINADMRKMQKKQTKEESPHDEVTPHKEVNEESEDSPK